MQYLPKSRMVVSQYFSKVLRSQAHSEPVNGRGRDFERLLNNRVLFWKADLVLLLYTYCKRRNVSCCKKRSNNNDNFFSVPSIATQQITDLEMFAWAE